MRIPCGMLAVILFTLAGVSAARALAVDPPIERVLKAEDGRSVDARIIGVTADTVELVRREDATRFKLAFARLGEEDRTFLTGLYRELLANQPLPDTPFLQLVRKDFVRAAADRKKTEPLPADAFARDRWVLLAVDEYFDGAHPPWTGRHLERLKVEEAPILWLLGRADGLKVELTADTLPERHAVLNARAAQAARNITEEMTNKALDDASRRDPPKSGEVWYPFADEAAEAAFEKRLLARLPAYWPRLPQVTFNERRREASPHVFLCRRDGSPAILRGHPVKGGLHEVINVLRKHEAELE